MIRNRIIIVIGLLLAMWIPASGQGEEAGTESLMRIGFGSRAMGMGRAFTAMGGDNASIYYNPAGLDLIQYDNVSLFHTNLIMDATYSFASFAYPTVHLGTFGIAIGGIIPGDFQITTSTPTPIGTGFLDTYRAYLSYGKKVLDYLYVGATFKGDYQNAKTSEGDAGTRLVTSVTFGADIAVLYKDKAPVVGQIQAGLNVINAIQPQRKLGEEADKLPTTIRFGVMKPLDVGNDGRLNVALDLAKPMVGPFQYNIGAEYIFKGLGALRAGMDNGTITAGLGVEWKGIGFDYAYGNLNTDGEFGAQHRFTLSYSFGMSRDDLERMEKMNAEQRDSLMVETALSEEKAKLIREGFEKGLKYMEDRLWFNATVEFQTILSIDPFNREARELFKQADSLLQKQYQQQQEALARKQADEAVALRDQEYIDGHYNKGREYLQKNQFIEALLEFNSALERDPENKVLLEARSTAQRRLDEAINQLISKGRAQYRQGNYSEALRLLSEAKVMLSEDNSLNAEIDQLSRRIQVQGDLTKGLEAMQAGEYKKAAEIFQLALKTDPTNEEIRKHLKRAEGKANARKVVLDPSDEKSYQLGVDRFLSGHYQEALDRWEKLLDKYPYSLKLINAVETAEERLRRTKSELLDK